jgi:hypothetical protein
MGQLALGFRSLLIKLAVFFVMAVLLAWALGGTLWPRAEIVNGDAVSYDGREWFWRLVAGGRQPDAMHWVLMQRRGAGDPEPVDGRTFIRVAPLVLTEDGLFYGVSTSSAADAQWTLERIDGTGATTTYAMPDRLAVERQLARVRAGMPIQDEQLIRELRPQVLDPPAPSTASEGS